MNAYQQKEAMKYQKSLGRLRLIVDELNELDLGDVTKFEIEPIPEDFDHTPRYIAISSLVMDGNESLPSYLEIMCERDGYGNNGRWEFRAAGWPSYKDENDKTCTVDPSDLWNPKATRPTTTAAQDRAPKAIAKQIASRLIPEYLSIYSRCTSRAEDAQGHSNERAEGLRRLAKACRDDRAFLGRRGSSFYIKELPGDAVSVDSNSHGDVQIRLHTDEMVKVIGLLRELRA